MGEIEHTVEQDACITLCDRAWQKELKKAPMKERGKAERGKQTDDLVRRGDGGSYGQVLSFNRCPFIVPNILFSVLFR
jgi:hypothetical protein